jgi:cobalt-zinc-cadmium efflux system outer membrane protein
LTSLGVARADVVQAGMLKNPVLSLLFPLGPKQFEAAATIAIDAIWQRPRRIADAKANAESVAETLVGTGLQLVADVKLAYVDAINTEHALAVLAQQADGAKQLGQMAAGRLRAGDISVFESKLAEGSAAVWEAARLSRASQRDQAVVRLRTLLDLPFDAPAIKLTDSTITAGVCGELPALVKDALAARPDVRAAELLIDAAGERAGLERAKTIAFTATLDMNGQGKEGFEMGPGIAIELPLLSINQGGRAKAAADLEQASRRYLAVRARVVADVQTAYVVLTNTKGAAAALATLIDSLPEQRRRAQSLFDAGELSLLSLLETRQRLNEVDLARLDAAAAAARASIQLERAVGRACPRQ